LNEARLLDLKASLRRAQRHLPEALEFLNQALVLSEPDIKGHLLINKAKVLEEQDDLPLAIATLEEAEPHVDPKREPRLWLCLRHNLLDYLSKIGRFKEAEGMVPEVRSLSRKELDRIRLRWAEGRIAAGLGRPEDARLLLDQARRGFDAREMFYDVALALQEHAGLLLAEGRTAEVKALALHLRQVFQSEEVHEEALSALRLFWEAVEREEATAELAYRILAFLFRARHDPGLRFKS